MDGIFVLFDPTRRHGQSVTGLSLLDVAPTVLELMGVPVPEGMEGHPLAAPGERAQSDRDTAVG
jgi:arylsulfatase A-like enzyme